MSGPLGKKLSWFMTVNARDFNTAQLLINAQIHESRPRSHPRSFNSSFFNSLEKLAGQSPNRLRDQLEQHPGVALRTHHWLE